MKCDYSTMDWYCCKEKGHKGDHESYPLKPFKSKLKEEEETK